MNVVIIDDEINCCEVLQLLLQKYCKQVTDVKLFNNSSEGLTYLRNNTPDLLFLDIEMPIFGVGDKDIFYLTFINVQLFNKKDPLCFC